MVWARAGSRARRSDWAPVEQLLRNNRNTQRSCSCRDVPDHLFSEESCNRRILRRTLRNGRELQPILVIRQLCLARRLSPLLSVVRKMNNTTPIAVWSYLVVATLFEWALAKSFLSLSTIYTNIVIAALAASQILTVALVFLRLKYEPRGIVGIAAASLFFAVLAVVLALGSIGH